MGERNRQDAPTLSPEEIARTFLGESHVTGRHVLRAGVSDADGRARTEPPPPPDLAGRYSLVRELGRGGMGRVDEIFDTNLGRTVAQKSTLPSGGVHHATLLVAEAQTCAQLEHPSIVPVYDLGAGIEGAPYYTMRKVRGRTLHEVLRDHADPEKVHRSLAQLLGILRQVCLAVDYAHSRGVVHRDLKPDNVIVGEFGEVYVLDWGIAHILEGSDVRRSVSLTVSAGTPGYMAPEQASAGPIGPETDVFALGVMLYEILAGTNPFHGERSDSIGEPSRKTVEVPPSQRNPLRAVSPAFDGLVLDCLAMEPAKRTRSARTIADAIDAFLDGERARAEREKEADEYASRAAAAFAEAERLERASTELLAQAEARLAAIARWADASDKQAAWELGAQGRTLSSDAAQARARGEADFIRALSRVSEHRAARSGLARLHYRQLLAAEERGEPEAVAEHLALARAYDDGALALELANQGELLVETSSDVTAVEVSRYETDGLLSRPGAPRPLERGRAELLDAGSYVLHVRRGEQETRYPVVVGRALRQRIRVRVPSPREVPDGFVVIPGGPFLTADGPRLRLANLPDFAIGRFPITFREYAAFLDALDPAERARRCWVGDSSPLEKTAAGWQLTDFAVEGEGRARISAERALDLPATDVSWYDAAAYARWRSGASGLLFRLPTHLEWEKAMRGADGRPFPMGHHLDPSFAKLRESRREASQPEPVGTFPLDESPYGVRDLAGGVGDWTSTSADGEPLPDPSEDGDERADAGQAVWCGGAWSMAANVRAMRFTQMLHHRVGWVGFRLALSLDAHGSSSLEVEPMKRR